MQKQSEDNIIKKIRNTFGLKKGNEAIKYRIIRGIKTLFEQQEDYYKPVTVGNFWNNSYTKHESNGDINKNLSIKEDLDKIKPYLKDIINDLQKSDTLKIQLTIAIKLISSKDIDEERVMHSTSDNMEVMTYDITWKS